MTDPTRDAAFALLSAVFERRRTLEDALDALPGIAPRDKAAAHRLAATVLRRAGTLDAVLETFLRKEPPPQVRTILRLGAAGLLLLDMPPHAAVATSVALAKARKLTPFAGLVNAVLRQVATAGLEALSGLDSPRLDTPAWLWTSWGRDARAIAEAHQREAPLDITLAPGAKPPDGGVRMPNGSWRYPPGTRVAALSGFASGAFWVQDAAAALPALLLDAKPGERIADLCAAPGGKAFQLAASGAQVTAVERDPARLARLRENLARLGFGVDCVTADATEWRPSEPLDAVLLDAPCSATGTIRRHPDVPHLRRPRDIAHLVAAQDRLLDAACAMLRPGGRLVYSVCSLQSEEGPERIRAALARLPLVPDLTVAPEVLGFAPSFALSTTPALWPEHGGMDGFHMARLVRI